jgi:AraC family transcriptional regulator of arabinose operon
MANVKYTNSARYKCLEFLKKDSLDLYLCYCGSEICAPGHAYGPETRTEYLIHIILSGEGTYTAGNKTYHLGANSAFLIYPGMTTYYEASKENPWTYIWVAFNGAKAASTLKHTHFSQDNLVVPIQDVSPFTNYVDGMLASSQLTYANDLAREGYLYQFLSALIKEQYIQDKHPEIHDYSYQIYVEHTLEYIEHNYRNNIKVQAIADYIGVNRSYLANCFKRILNMSPKEYIINYRMNQAGLLLKNTDLPISEIAVSVGYDDCFNFSKAFKKVFGTSPKAYRHAPENLDISYKESPH